MKAAELARHLLGRPGADVLVVTSDAHGAIARPIAGAYHHDADRIVLTLQQPAGGRRKAETGDPR